MGASILFGFLIQGMEFNLVNHFMSQLDQETLAMYANEATELHGLGSGPQGLAGEGLGALQLTALERV